MEETSVSLLDRLAVAPSDADWRRLFDLYTPLLRQWAIRAGVSDADADDLAQDVMLAVHRDVAGFDRRGQGAFRGWLRSVLANRLRNHFRQLKTRPSPAEALEGLEDGTGELSQLWNKEHDEHIARQVLRRAEVDFSPATWRAFSRQVIDGLTPAETAKELNLTVNAVLVAKSRVLKRLREEAAGLL